MPSPSEDRWKESSSLLLIFSIIGKFRTGTLRLPPGFQSAALGACHCHILPAKHSSLYNQLHPATFRCVYVKGFCATACCCSVVKSCPALCYPMDHSMLGFRVFYHLLEFAQTHVHWVSDATQPFHPLSPPSPPALNLCQRQDLFQWTDASHQVAKITELQLQQWLVLPVNSQGWFPLELVDWCDAIGRVNKRNGCRKIAEDLNATCLPCLQRQPKAEFKTGWERIGSQNDKRGWGQVWSAHQKQPFF